MANLQNIKDEYGRIVMMYKKEKVQDGVSMQDQEDLEKVETIEAIKQFLKEWEDNIGVLDCNYFCPNHLLEVYLYDFYAPQSECQCIEYRIHELYRMVAKSYEQEGKTQLALEAYHKSLNYNEVDLETLFDLAQYHHKLGELKQYYQVVQDLYPFCYTVSDIARYYRFLGCYYLESYQPDLAEVLYEYSNLFYESKMAEEELKYLEKALQRKKKTYELEELQEILVEYSIPIQPKQETLAIIYQLGKQQLKQNNKDYVKFLFTCLYQLTQDDEVGEIIQSIED